jgi:hypothetical protein
MRKIHCLQVLATKIEMGIHYKQTDMYKSNSTMGEKKTNTLLHHINVCFDEDFWSRVVKSTSSKKRHDFEGSTKHNPDDDL